MYVPSEIFFTMIFMIFLMEIAIAAVILHLIIKADNFVLSLIPKCDKFREDLLCGVYKLCGGVMTVQNFICASLTTIERKKTEILRGVINATIIYIVIYMITGKFKNCGNIYKLAVALNNIGYLFFA